MTLDGSRMQRRGLHWWLAIVIVTCKQHAAGLANAFCPHNSPQRVSLHSGHLREQPIAASFVRGILETPTGLQQGKALI